MSDLPAPSGSPSATASDELRARIEALLRAVAVELRRCRRCGADLAFVVHRNGHTAPYTLDGVNHFANCPHAASFRRRKPTPPEPGQAALFDTAPEPD